MNPRDLLNFDKMEELNSTVKKMKNFAVKEEIKKLGKGKDNFSDLNKLNQEGNQYEFREEQF